MSRRSLAYCLLMLCMGAAGAPLGASAQQPVGLPSQQFSAVSALDTVPVDQLPAVNTDSLRAEAEEQRDEMGPYRYGRILRTDVSPTQDGTWERLPSGEWLWRYRIYSPDARSLSLGFTHFVLPDGARLFAHEGAGRTIRGPYTRTDATNGQHWTPLVRGDEIVVELVVPDGKRSSVRVTLGKVVHGYRSIRPTEQSGAASKAGSCNLDVACEEADPWRDQVRSVGLYTYQQGKSASTCTGSLMNNTAEDERPFFLTAEHCVSSPSTVSTMVFYWNYQNETCRTPGTTENGNVTDDDKFDQTSSGAVLRARYGSTHEDGTIAGKSDLTLVEVDDDIPPSYNLFFSGWSRKGDSTAEGVTIHHPQGHGKRISFDRDPSSLIGYPTSGSCPIQAPDGDTHLEIQNWEVGTTEGGSSGAPLFDTNHRVVGVLSGGCAGCGSGDDPAEDNDQSDWYGRIGPGFENGDYEGNTLADWLDPINSGTLVLDGRTQERIPRPAPPTSVTATAASDSVTLSWTASDSADVVRYRIYRASAPIDSTTVPPNGSPHDSVSAEQTQYTDTRVKLSTKYYYRLTAVDDSSIESSPSNQSTARPGERPVAAVQPDSIVGRAARDSTTEQQATITNEGPSNSRLRFSVDGFAARALLSRVPDHKHNRPRQQHDHADLEKGATDSRTGAPVTLGAGGPDNFGHRWIDSHEPGGPAFRWTDIRSAGNQTFLGDDASFTVETPDGFSFYGTDRSTVSISSNGYLTFGGGTSSYANDAIPDTTGPNAIIAPFWDDLNPSAGGTVHYLRDTENGRLVVQWTDVPYYGGGSGANTFQVILEASGTIRYRYLEMAPRQEATVGIENDDGSDGLQVAFNTAYVTDSLAVRIATTPPLVADVEPASGTLRPGASDEVSVTLDASRPPGTYRGRLAISTNDPGAESVDLPLKLTVGGRPAPPPDLTATVNAESVSLDWSAPPALEISTYRIYRTTSPADFEEGPASLSPVDSVDGSTTQYTGTPEPGQTYHYRITAANDEGESPFSDEVSAFLYPTQIQASVDRSFESTTDSTGYRLVALPGAISRPLSETIEGEAGVDWQAYWDDGSDTDFLVAFDGSDRFTFEPGIGFWLTAATNWTSSVTTPTVDLRGDSAATIGLREGWNVISNPTDKDVAWNRVEAATADSMQALWTFDGAFARADTFRSARNGIAYYFFNGRARDSLVIPYPGAPGTSASAPGEGEETSSLLALSAQPAAVPDAPTTTVRMGIADGASPGLGPDDLVAPPNRFAETSLRIEGPDEGTSPRTRFLMTDRRPPAETAGGHTFVLRLSSPGDRTIDLSPRNLEAVAGREVRLLYPANGMTYDLREQSSIPIEPSGDVTTLKVAVGTAEYVEDEARDVLPTEVRLTSYPNPVRQQATIEYALPEPQSVTLRVYDVLGREVATLAHGRKRAGRHTVHLDPDLLASGVYFGRLTTGDRTLTRKITVVR